MKFEGGLDGRPATEFTFLPIDPLVAKGQEEALNPSGCFCARTFPVLADYQSRHHYKSHL
jgi:hypothetical protein